MRLPEFLFVASVTCVVGGQQRFAPHSCAVKCSALQREFEDAKKKRIFLTRPLPLQNSSPCATRLAVEKDTEPLPMGEGKFCVIQLRVILLWAQEIGYRRPWQDGRDA